MKIISDSKKNVGILLTVEEAERLKALLCSIVAEGVHPDEAEERRHLLAKFVKVDLGSPSFKKICMTYNELNASLNGEKISWSSSRL